MKIKNLVIIFSILAALGFSAQINILNHDFAFAETRETQTVTESRKWIFWTDQQQSSTTLTITASFNLVELLYLEPANKELVQNVLYAGKTFADYAKQRFTEFSQFASAAEELLYSQNYTYTEEVNAVFLSPQILILNKSCYSYTGGAHGNYSKEIYVLDLETNRQLTLSDIFIPEAGTVLTPYLEAALRQQYGTQDDKFTAEVWPPTNFVFTDSALELSWGLYAVGPYTWGLPVVALQYLDIQSLLTAKGLAVQRVLQNPVYKQN